jgi:hypothetical protein
MFNSFPTHLIFFLPGFGSFCVAARQANARASVAAALWLLGGVLGIAAVVVWSVQAHERLETFIETAVASELNVNLGFSFGLFITTSVIQFACAGLAAMISLAESGSAALST